MSTFARLITSPNRVLFTVDVGSVAATTGTDDTDVLDLRQFGALSRCIVSANQSTTPGAGVSFTPYASSDAAKTRTAVCCTTVSGTSKASIYSFNTVNLAAEFYVPAPFFYINLVNLTGTQMEDVFYFVEFVSAG